MKTRLRGITWNHTRGYLPMAATAQRFHETHPEVGITWEKRSLQEFADSPIQKLAETFDLLVIDHPFVGYAAAHGTLLPLDDYLPREYLEDQEKNTVGPSHRSYHYGAHQWALAIDAATPVSIWRPDLLGTPPKTWTELMELAREGRVAVPAIPVDSLMNIYMLCLAGGEEPFLHDDLLVSEEIGMQALKRLRELVTACEPACLQRNPIQTCEAMAAGDTIAYCPFAYGYSNYSRDGYARHLLKFGGLVDDLRSTLGGTGLAISARSGCKAVAVEYARYAASANCQRTLYTQSGGQPGHRAAWLDAEANRLSHDYFRDTLPVLDCAWLRPRYDGYLHFQDMAGPVVHQMLQGELKPAEALRRMQKLYLHSRK